MPMISAGFALFALCSAAAYRLVPQRGRYLVLMAANIGFCCTSGIPALGIVMGSASLCYLSALFVQRLCGKENRAAARALALCTALAECALMLSFRGRFAGVSFYVLIHIAYVLDVFRGRSRATESWPMFIACAAFFPVLTQGPIMRVDAIAAQIRQGERVSWAAFTDGLLRILSGLLKKLVLAQRLAVYVGAVYGDIAGCSAPALWMALLAYAVEIYADFSGCMNMVIGTAGLFGIRLRENFRAPYLAASFEEYWRRWHITMGEWFREYVFYPLASLSIRFTVLQDAIGRVKGRAAKRALTVVIPLMTTWLVTGLWHGSAGHYLLWGAVNGLLILAEGCAAKKERQKGMHAALALRTFAVTAVVRVLFRADSVSDAWALYAGLLRFGQGRGILECGVDAADFAVAGAAAAVMFAADLLMHRRSSGHVRHRALARLALGFAGIAALVIFGCYGPGYHPSEFYYSRF